MKDMDAAERSKPQLTKTPCTGFSPVNISLWVFLQKLTLEPKSLLKYVQNYPGNIYNINSKTAEKTFLNQSLTHLCHLVNKTSWGAFGRGKTDLGVLRNACWLWNVLWWLTGLTAFIHQCWAASFKAQKVDKWMWPDKPEPQKALLCHRGKKKSNNWISLPSAHSPISSISSKCVQWSNKQLRVILGSDI